LLSVGAPLPLVVRHCLPRFFSLIDLALPQLSGFHPERVLRYRNERKE